MVEPETRLIYAGLSVGGLSFNFPITVEGLHGMYLVLTAWVLP